MDGGFSLCSQNATGIAEGDRVGHGMYGEMMAFLPQRYMILALEAQMSDASILNSRACGKRTIGIFGTLSVRQYRNCSYWLWSLSLAIERR